MIKILKTAHCYPRYINWFYGRNPGLECQPYEEQLEKLHQDSFAKNSWKHYLEPSGQFQVEDVILNVEPLQKRWAFENKVQYDESNWMEDIFVAQLRAHRPDVIFVNHHGILLNTLPKLKARGEAPFYTIGFDGIAAHDQGMVLDVDLVLTCLQRTASFYEKMGRKAYVMPHGFDPQILERSRSVVAESVDVSFIGQASILGTHRERAELLAAVVRRVPADYWLGNLPSNYSFIRNKLGAIKRGQNPELLGVPKVLSDLRRLRGVNRGELYGLEMFSQMAASKISLNCHIAAAGKHAANMRLFEATGMGSCLLTDWKDNMADLFEPDQEVVTFSSADEAVEKILWLLENEQARSDIALAGQKRTLATHNVKNDLIEFGDYLTALL